MLQIRKIWGDTYLVNGEYITQNYNQAVIIANTGKKIKGFEVDCMELSFKGCFKFKVKRLVKILWCCINRPFDILMECV